MKSRDLYIAQSSRQFVDKQEGQRHRRERLAELDDLIANLRAATPQTFQIREQIRQLEERKRQVEDMDRAKDLTPDKQVPAYVSLSLGSAYFEKWKAPGSGNRVSRRNRGRREPAEGAQQSRRRLLRNRTIRAGQGVAARRRKSRRQGSPRIESGYRSEGRGQMTIHELDAQFATNACHGRPAVDDSHIRRRR